MHELIANTTRPVEQKAGHSAAPGQNCPPAVVPAQSPPALLTITEFHRHFQARIGKNALYRLVSSGRIRSIRLGERKILIPSTELHDWPAREVERAN
jgi:excisionase family DNA binding protein